MTATEFRQHHVQIFNADFLRQFREDAFRVNKQESQCNDVFVERYCCSSASCAVRGLLVSRVSPHVGTRPRCLNGFVIAEATAWI